MKEKNEGNKYDKIVKENFSKMFLPLLNKRFNLGIIQAKELTPKFQTTVEREVDFLRLVTDKNGNQFVLHVEFQTKFESELIFRIKEYEAMIQRRYKLPVKSIVMNLGTTNRLPTTKLPNDYIFSEYHELNFSEIDAGYFLNSGIPEVIIFAILGNISDAEALKITKDVIIQLDKNCESKANFNKFMNQLLMLSQIRKLETNVFQLINHMPLDLDLRKNEVLGPIILELESEIENKLTKLENQQSKLENQQSKLERFEIQISDSIKKLLLKNTMTDKEIADILSVPTAYVQQIKKGLDLNN